MEEFIRDRKVVGIRDPSLSEKLQLDADLTLTTAIVRVRQAEALKKQQPVVRSETPGKKLIFLWGQCREKGGAENKWESPEVLLTNNLPGTPSHNLCLSPRALLASVAGVGEVHHSPAL
jgi:hypothetical protein